jgi:uncharacterized membrane protein YfcA
MPDLSIFLVIGVCAGTLAGLFGVGGGLIVVPALVLGIGLSRDAAAGTSLVALLAPVGLGGVYAYYRMGKIGPEHIKMGLLISLGMFVGSYLGARLATGFSDSVLKRMFSLFLIIVAVKFWWSTIS